MEDFPMQEITIYHKNEKIWDRYCVKGSYRNTSILNRNKSGSNSTDNALIRIFDVSGYNETWFISKGDIIVNKSVDDEIIIKEDFAPYGDKAYEYVIENPRKIADRISGNYKFDIALIESIEKKITGGRRRL